MNVKETFTLSPAKFDLARDNIIEVYHTSEIPSTANITVVSSKKVTAPALCVSSVRVGTFWKLHLKRLS